MYDEGDELIKEFTQEAREHLSTIETDLLQIEEQGEDVDEEVVNKVFRAAHSIKGGSGFFGLDNVRDLAHKAENVLDLIRSRTMVPNPEIINILLAAFDKLREMINNPGESHNMPVEDLVGNLVALASSYLPQEKKGMVSGQVVLKGPIELGEVTISQMDMDRIQSAGQSIYWLDGDLIHDLETQGRTILGLYQDLSTDWDILECRVDYESVGTLDNPVSKKLPLRVIMATTLGREEAARRLGLSDQARLVTLHEATKDDSSLEDPTAPVLGVYSVGTSLRAPENPVLARKQDNDVAVPPPRQENPRQELPGSESVPGLGRGSSSTVEETLRVNVSLLENLMNLAGELVLSRNQLRSAVSQDRADILLSAYQRINQVTAELQDVIMQTRLQPIDLVFSKFPRMIRDLSRKLGKEIDLEIIGKDVALDKTLIEGLSDPLTHMIRNAVDHGIETTEERLARGKPRTGKVRLAARYEAGLVVIDLRDDGKGIDGNRIASAALSKGLITEEKLAGLSERDRQALVFLPGLSTARDVSDLSGRGVGMDVVKTNLDRLGGQMEIHSVPGEGSTFRIKLPLTLAIMPSLIVRLGQERYAIPQTNIEELLRLRAGEVRQRIEIIGDTEVLLLRDRVLPLARLSDVLGTVATYLDPVSGRREVDRRVRLADRRSPQYSLEEKASDVQAAETDEAPEKGRKRSDRRMNAGSAMEIAVVNTGTMSYALVVDAFQDSEEIVVKALGQRLKSLTEYSGVTILGDGTLAIILDMAGLAVKAGLSSVDASARAAEIAAEEENQDEQSLQAMLVFENSPGEPCAVPLDLVQRIERITQNKIERLGQQRSIQYRGGSLPLVSLSDMARVAPVESREDLVVLVTHQGGREVGLLGALPVDVLETHTQIDAHTHRQPGIAGSAIIKDRTTLVVDLPELVGRLGPAQVATASVAVETDASGGSPPRKSGAGGPVVLLAEDSDFFRSQVKKFLEKEGFTVLAAPDGEAGWSLLLENLEAVQLVVTDIEMPRLDGLGLTRRIRNDSRTAALPVIAVTSLAGDSDMEKGMAVGVTEYQIKLDREQLVASVRKHLTAPGAANLNKEQQ